MMTNGYNSLITKGISMKLHIYDILVIPYDIFEIL